MVLSVHLYDGYKFISQGELMLRTVRKLYIYGNVNGHSHVTYRKRQQKCENELIMLNFGMYFIYGYRNNMITIVLLQIKIQESEYFEKRNNVLHAIYNIYTF
jgi:hypothetical protein